MAAAITTGKTLEVDDTSEAGEKLLDGEDSASLLSTVSSEIRAGKMENGRIYASFGTHGGFVILQIIRRGGMGL